MPEPFRLLTQGEIEVLRYLGERNAHVRPIHLPTRLRAAVPALWRMGLVEVWWKSEPHDEPQPLGAYYALSIAGWSRAQPFLFTSRRAATAARTSTFQRRRPPSGGS